MVSPLYKQSFDAVPVTGSGVLVAPAGGEEGTAGFQSQGDFANPQDYEAAGFVPKNFYTARRGPSGWVTSSAFAPAALIPLHSETGLASDFSPDLRSVQVSCGAQYNGKAEQPQVFTGVRCATHKPDGSWSATEIFRSPFNTSLVFTQFYMGGSEDLSRVFIQPGRALVPYDEASATSSGSAGIYEIAGVGTPTQELRLANVEGGLNSR